jgi:hypothetical protein
LKKKETKQKEKKRKKRKEKKRKKDNNPNPRKLTLNIRIKYYSLPIKAPSSMFSYIEHIKKEGLLIFFLRDIEQIYKLNESLFI